MNIDFFLYNCAVFWGGQHYVERHWYRRSAQFFFFLLSKAFLKVIVILSSCYFELHSKYLTGFFATIWRNISCNVDMPSKQSSEVNPWQGQARWGLLGQTTEADVLQLATFFAPYVNWSKMLKMSAKCKYIRININKWVYQILRLDTIHNTNYTTLH